MASDLITSKQVVEEKVEIVADFNLLGSKIIVDGDCSHTIKRHFLLGRKAMTNLDNILKSKGITLPTSLSSQRYGFSSSHVQMWELDHKGGWEAKNWCFWTMVLEKTLESPLDSKEMKPVNPKGTKPRLFIGRTDEAQIFWPSDENSWLTGKDPDAEKDWRQEEKRVTEDEMGGWDHQLNGHEFEQTPGDSNGQGRLACCSLWGCKESDKTQWSNTQLFLFHICVIIIYWNYLLITFWINIRQWKILHKIFKKKLQISKNSPISL